MTEVERVREFAHVALASLERNRQRIDDLNVYPVPDGDTGTNLTLTARSVVEDLDKTTAADRPALAHAVTRAALMGARGNSGVIFSQIVRGAAEVLGAAERLNSPTFARALRGASDAAYRAVRRPVEGTMLSVIREMAEEAEERATTPDLPLPELLSAVVARGEDALARTPEQLAVLREAGVVDAGGAGLLEIVRGLAAGVAGEPIPEAPEHREELGFDAIHQELSRYRYCTVFVVEGEGLDREALEAELEPLGDSLLVVGDDTALKIHVHTDDPGQILSMGGAIGVLDGVEIANMHRQTEERQERLLEAVPDAEPNASDVIAVVAGAGNRRLFQSLGAATVIEGGQTMNPSTAQLVEAIDAARAPEVLLLPNNDNVILTAEQAAGLATKPVEVVPSRSIQAGLAAMVAYDGSRSAEENAEEMREALDAVATGEVTIASRDAQLNGVAVREGNYLGLAEGKAIAGGESFEEVARAVIERLLDEPRGLLTLLTGDGGPPLGDLIKGVEERHPELELDIQAGGQPH
ncbi:MAG: DAK2 domain-containing protein [Actinomycetota bacterium]|nr:DAK2 domain-containing protein [Actinomycetota bacterium]